jgi:signal transduction histidine kinase
MRPEGGRRRGVRPGSPGTLGTPTAPAALAALALFLAVAAFARELPDDPSSLPFRLTPAAPMAEAPLFAALVDLDGDGVDESVRVDRSADGAYWQWSVDRLVEGARYQVFSERLTDQLGCAGVVDLDADGAPELAVWRQSGDSVVLTSVEVRLGRTSASRETVAAFSWDVSGGVLPHGLWRGSVELAGVVDRDGDGDEESAVLLLQGGTLGHPRAVSVHDVANGECIWSVQTGATPGVAAIVDMDGDGEREIAVGLEPSGSSTVGGGWNDLASRVVVFGLDGAVLWEREMAGPGSFLDIVPADLTGDGLTELLVGVTRDEPENEAGLIVLNGHGDTVLDALRGVCVADLAVLGDVVYAACGDGVLRRVKLEGSSVLVDRSLSAGVELRRVEVVRLGSPERDAVVFGSAEGVLAAADIDLRPLAMTVTSEAGPGRRAALAGGRFIGSAGPVAGVSAATAERLRFLVLEPRERGLTLFVALGVLVPACIVALVPRSRRSVLSWTRERITPDAERGESIDEILDRLRTGSHGKLSITRPVRHLVDNLHMLGDQEGGITDSFRGRYADMVDRARGEGVAAVDALRRATERTGLAPEATAALARSVRSLRGTLAGVGPEVPSESESIRLATLLQSAIEPVGGALEAIRDAARRERSASLGATLEAAVTPWLEEADRLGARIETPEFEELKSLRVYATPQELEHTFDNLTGNALRALEGTKTPRLAITWSEEGDEVRVSFEDNGRGIEAARHEAVFLEGVTDREGGGSGLPTSREALKRRGGDVRLVRSAPGDGSVFEVRLLRVRRRTS